MAIKSYITDPSTGHSARVTTGRALGVGVLPVPASDVSNELLTIRKYFSAFAATAAGATNMNVAGSAAAPILFEVGAGADRTIVVTKLRVLFESATAVVTTTDSRRFGAATAANTPLANGVLLQAIQGGTTTNIFTTPVRVLGDFLNFFDDFTSLPNAVAAGVDYDRFDLVLPAPVFLPEGTRDRIRVTIQDSLVALTTFQLLATGYYELPAG